MVDEAELFGPENPHEFSVTSKLRSRGGRGREQDDDKCDCDATGHAPNEWELSHRWRERAWLAVEMFHQAKRSIGTASGWLERLVRALRMAMGCGMDGIAACMEHLSL